MKKKFKLILALGCASLACAGFAACVPGTLAEEYQQDGYKISVTYDANGGKFLEDENTNLMDMFNPDKYTAGQDGKIHIQLWDPLSKNRPSTSDSITLSKSGHFLAGWYQTREVVKDEDGSPVDEYGEKLVQTGEDTYVYADTVNDKTPKKATPAYNYSDYWDFEEDTLDYAEADYEDGICEITLYAAWVRDYEFNYYYKMVDDMEADWTKLNEKTTFNYKTVNAEGSNTADRDTIWLPEWAEGDCTTNYTYRYANGNPYTFPNPDNTTFSKAYSDSDCTNELTGAVEHHGTLIVDDGENESLKVENRVQDIYIVLEAGEQYRISTAEELVKNSNEYGVYEILGNLDFEGLTWPAQFSGGSFKGKMFSAEGNTYTLSNISVQYNNVGKTSGVFGVLTKDVEIKNLNFTNVTFDMTSLSINKGEEPSEDDQWTFGLFAGMIEEGAKFSNVSVGGTFKLGDVQLPLGEAPKFNLFANGDTTGLTKNAITLQVYGVNPIAKGYNYTVDPDSVTVDENGNISFSNTTVQTRYKPDEVTTIEYNK